MPLITAWVAFPRCSPLRTWPALPGAKGPASGPEAAPRPGEGVGAVASTSPGEWRLQATFMAKRRGFGISVQHQAICPRIFRQKKARIMQGFSYKCCCLGEKKVFFFFFFIHQDKF